MMNGTPPHSREKAPPASGANRPDHALRQPTDSPPLLRLFDLPRAVGRRLADGRAQGWSGRTLTDHRQNLERFAWWIENEAEEVAVLETLFPDSRLSRLSPGAVYCRLVRKR